MGNNSSIFLDCFPELFSRNSDRKFNTRIQGLIQEIEKDAGIDKKTKQELQRLLDKHFLETTGDEESNYDFLAEISVDKMKDSIDPNSASFEDSNNVEAMKRRINELMQMISSKSEKVEMSTQTTANETLQSKDLEIQSLQITIDNQKKSISENKRLNAQQQHDFVEKVQSFLEEETKLKKRIHELEKNSNPSQNSDSQKIEEILSRIDGIYSSEGFEIFKRCILKLFEKSPHDKTLKSRIHAFCVFELFSRVEQIVQTSEENLDFPKFLVDLISNLKEKFEKNEEAFMIDKILDEDKKSVENLVVQVFEICKDMKNTKMSFYVPSANEEYLEQICQARNASQRGNGSKILMTMAPGVLFSDLQTWKSMIKRKADVILQ